jgi:hypothetical protein
MDEVLNNNRPVFADLLLLLALGQRLTNELLQ